MRLSTLVLTLLILLSACSPVQPQPEYEVITHPDGPLYVGDQVSFEVIGKGEQIDGETVEVTLDGQSLGSTPFGPFGIGQRQEATLWWTWDTSSLEPDRYPLNFKLGSGYSWNESILLNPAKRAPLADSQWAEELIDCCAIHYITGTAAERDLSDLSIIADQQSKLVAEQMGTSLQERIDVTFMPRVIGHGGFAWDGLYISYQDGNYSGNEVDIILHHEFVHFYDVEVGGDYLPSIFQEGLATYFSGGHFKVEPIVSRAAALLELNRYIPLETLANDFYQQQHETGYLEAAALVGYLYETYGPSAFNEFYRTIPFPDGSTPAEVIDTSLQESYHLSFVELENLFKLYLASQPVPEDVRRDLEVTIDFFDTLRRYQSLLDPSAYYLTAWLPDGRAMRERNIVADLTRRPTGVLNRSMEWLLIHARGNWFTEEYRPAENTIDITNWLLDIVDKKD
jgi:hypothetical protein